MRRQILVMKTDARVLSTRKHLSCHGRPPGAPLMFRAHLVGRVWGAHAAHTLRPPHKTQVHSLMPCCTCVTSWHNAHYCHKLNTLWITRLVPPIEKSKST